MNTVFTVEAFEGWLLNVTSSINHLTVTPYLRCLQYSVLLKAEMIQAQGARSLTPAHRAAVVDTRNGSRRAGVGDYDDTSHLVAQLKRQLFYIVVHCFFCKIF